MMMPQTQSKTDTKACRGQAYIAEALFAVILLAGIMFVATTTLAIDEPPLSADERETRAELKADAHAVVEQSKRDGAIKSSILSWSDTTGKYDEEGFGDVYYSSGLPGLFGDRLERLEDRQQARVNVRIIPARNASADESFNRTRPEPVGYFNESDAGTRLTTIDTEITLYGGDRLQSPPRAHRTGQTPSMTDNGEKKLVDADTYPVPPAQESVSESDVYNVVNVRVSIWA